MSLLIRGGQLIDPVSRKDGLFDVWIVGGKVKAVGKDLTKRFNLRGVETLDAKVLTFDYLGALCASLLFPILLVPALGLVRTSLLFGVANAAVGLWTTWIFEPLRSATDLRVKAVVVPNEGASPSEEEIREFCAEALAYFKVPELIEVRDEPLPRNATGKVMKHVLEGTGENTFVEE